MTIPNPEKDFLKFTNQYNCIAKLLEENWPKSFQYYLDELKTDFCLCLNTHKFRTQQVFGLIFLLLCLIWSLVSEKHH